MTDGENRDVEQATTSPSPLTSHRAPLPDPRDVYDPSHGQTERLAQIHRRVRDEKMPANTRRVYQADLKYWDAWFEAWCWWSWEREHPDADPLDAPAFRLPFPTPIPIVRHFIVHHLDAMPEDIDDTLVGQGVKKKPGPVTPPAVDRRLAALAYLHRNHGHAPPSQDPNVREDMKLFRKGYRPSHKSASAGTRDVLSRIIETCDTENVLIDLRDAAIVMVMYSSGGRRRAEIGMLTLRDVVRERNGYKLMLWGTKTRKEGEALSVPVKGTPARTLNRWIKQANLKRSDQYVFPAFDQFGRMKDPAIRGINGDDVNRMIRRRAHQAINRLYQQRPVVDEKAQEDIDRDIEALNGLTAHGIRSGFLTDAMRMRIPRKLAQELADIRSPRTLDRYERGATVMSSEAGDLWDTPEDS